MNRFSLAVVAVALIVAFASPHDVLAEEGQQTLREECRSIAAGHGVEGERLDAWVERCVENTTRIRKEMEDERRAAPDPHAAPREGHGH